MDSSTGERNSNDLLGNLVATKAQGMEAADESALAASAAQAKLRKKKRAEHRKAYEGNSDVLVLPGLVADRKERKVDILVEATGLAGGAVAEFLLVDQSSSHGYEALLWSFAKPSDVHAALLFIGLRPGAPYNPRALRSTR